MKTIRQVSSIDTRVEFEQGVRNRIKELLLDPSINTTLANEEIEVPRFKGMEPKILVQLSSVFVKRLIQSKWSPSKILHLPRVGEGVLIYIGEDEALYLDLMEVAGEVFMIASDQPFSPLQNYKTKDGTPKRLLGHKTNTRCHYGQVVTSGASKVNPMGELLNWKVVNSHHFFTTRTGDPDVTKLTATLERRLEAQEVLSSVLSHLEEGQYDHQRKIIVGFTFPNKDLKSGYGFLMEDTSNISEVFGATFTFDGDDIVIETYN